MRVHIFSVSVIARRP